MPAVRSTLVTHAAIPTSRRLSELRPSTGTFCRTGSSLKNLLSGGVLGRIVTNKQFDTFILVIIVLNATWIGVDLDHNPTNHPEKKGKIVFTIVENLFTAVFFVEIVIRFFSYNRWLSFFIDPRMRLWNWFDSLLVCLMVVETWIIEIYSAIAGSDQGVGVPKALQPLRLLRLLRITRIFRMLPELGMMVKSMIAALRSVYATVTLAVCIMYVFSIIFTGWYLALSREEQCVIWTPGTAGRASEEICFETFFGSIPSSLLTCGQLLIFDDTFALIRPVFEANIIIGFCLLLFLVLAAFTVLNMLIGVICEIVGSTTSEEKEKVLKQRVVEVFATIDCDQSGSITRSEFDKASRELLAPLGFDEHLIEKAFDLIDINCSGQLELEEFISTVFKMLHPPQSADLLLLSRKVDKLSEYMGCPAHVGFTRSGTIESRSPVGEEVTNHRGFGRAKTLDMGEPKKHPLRVSYSKGQQSSLTLAPPAGLKDNAMSPNFNSAGLDEFQEEASRITSIMDQLEKLLKQQDEYRIEMDKHMRDINRRLDAEHDSLMAVTHFVKKMSTHMEPPLAATQKGILWGPEAERRSESTHAFVSEGKEVDSRGWGCMSLPVTDKANVPEMILLRGQPPPPPTPPATLARGGRDSEGARRECNSIPLEDEVTVPSSPHACAVCGQDRSRNCGHEP